MNVERSAAQSAAIMAVLYDENLMAHHIMPELSFDEIQTLGRVDKKLNALTSTTSIPALLKEKFYRDKTMNLEDWIVLKEEIKCAFNLECSGVLAFSALPDNVVAIFKNPSPQNSNKKFGDTHLCVWIPPNIDKDMCSSLFLYQSPKNDTEFRVEPQGKTGNGRWMIMPRTFASTKQRGEFKEFANKEFISQFIPTSLEVMICIIGALAKFNIKIFHNHFIKCADDIIDEEASNRFPGLGKTPYLKLIVGYNNNSLIVGHERLEDCLKDCQIKNAVAWKFSTIKEIKQSYESIL